MRPAFERQLNDFGFGPSYIHDYVAKRVAELGGADAWETCESLESFCVQAPAAGEYARYLLSTLWRGENIVKNLSSLLDKKHRRVLDVGCGFGGGLAAFAKRKFDVTGVELDSERAAAARLLLLDQNVRGQICSLDVYSDAFNELGKFDVIVAENVVEHVNDPRMFLTRLSSCLNQDGIVYLEIPNCQSVQYVSAEPHYSLPLVLLLRHHSAKAVFHAVVDTKGAGYRYDVGEYYPLGWYEGLLTALQFKVQSIPHPHATRTREEFAALFVKIAQSAADIPQRYAQCDVFLRDELQLVTWNYLSRAASALHDNLAQGDTALTHEFLADAWIVMGRKHAAQ
jgi:2-polyprenyl-3-methyl-5-hydroxy-6-metoxy-1,4-benzoquinol methylase